MRRSAILAALAAAFALTTLSPETFGQARGGGGGGGAAPGGVGGGGARAGGGPMGGGPAGGARPGLVAPGTQVGGQTAGGPGVGPGNPNVGPAANLGQNQAQNQGANPAPNGNSQPGINRSNPALNGTMGMTREQRSQATRAARGAIANQKALGGQATTTQQDVQNANNNQNADSQNANQNANKNGYVNPDYFRERFGREASPENPNANASASPAARSANTSSNNFSGNDESTLDEARRTARARGTDPAQPSNRQPVNRTRGSGRFNTNTDGTSATSDSTTDGTVDVPDRAVGRGSEFQRRNYDYGAFDRQSDGAPLNRRSNGRPGSFFNDDASGTTVNNGGNSNNQLIGAKNPDGSVDTTGFDSSANNANRAEVLEQNNALRNNSTLRNNALRNGATVNDSSVNNDGTTVDRFGNRLNTNATTRSLSSRLNPAATQLRDTVGISFDRTAGDTGGRGLTISEVTIGSLADTAGLVAGDRIVSANGQRLFSGRDLSDVLRENDNQGTVALRVFRDGLYQTVNLDISTLANVLGNSR